MTRDYAKKRRIISSPKSRNRYGRVTHGRNETLMPAWAWMSSGLILGLSLSGMFYWKFHMSENLKTPIFSHVQPSSIPNPTPVKKAKNKPNTAATEINTTTRFDFYTLLPTMKVDVPEVDPSAASSDTLLTDNTSTSEVIETVASLSKTEEDPSNQTQPPSISSPASPPTSPTSLSPMTPTTTLAAATGSLPKTALKSQTSLAGPYIIQAGSFRLLSQAEELKAQLALSGFEASIQTFKVGAKDARYRVYIGPFSNKEQAAAKQKQLEQTQALHSLVLKNHV